MLSCARFQCVAGAFACGSHLFDAWALPACAWAEAEVIHCRAVCVYTCMSVTNRLIIAVLSVAVMNGCVSVQEDPVQAVSNVDIRRFMGDWYVIASIPTFAERRAVNPIENYQLNPDGSVKTTFSFYRGYGDLSGKTLTMTGFPNPAPENGVWEMQPFWPIRADYRIAYLDDAYEFAVIARNKRDYLWIMARSQQVSQSKYEEMVDFAVTLGYEREHILRSQWRHQTADRT